MVTSPPSVDTPPQRGRPRPPRGADQFSHSFHRACLRQLGRTPRYAGEQCLLAVRPGEQESNLGGELQS